MVTVRWGKRYCCDIRRVLPGIRLAVTIYAISAALAEVCTLVSGSLVSAVKIAHFQKHLCVFPAFCE